MRHSAESAPVTPPPRGRSQWRAVTAALLLAFCAIAGLSGRPSAASSSPQDELRGALTQLSANYDTVTRKMGTDQAANLEERLDTDLGWMPDSTPPPGYNADQWNQRVAMQADLDASIVTQVVAGGSAAITGVQGIVERLIVSRKDGMLAPFALYVPAHLAAVPTLVVLLHGNPQYDSEILSSRYFRQFADDNGVIVAAPYGRGIYNFAPPADDEVYQVSDEVAAAYHIAPKNVYLVGYSMGGFSVFKIGPIDPTHWTAVMAIAGAAYGSEVDRFHAAFQHTPIYVITGTADESIPTQYPQNTAVYLNSVGVPTGLYIVRGGTHAIATLAPTISAAWQDMLSGKIRASAWPPRVTGTTTDTPTMVTMPNGLRQ
jgi:dienelactone hydrolase